MTMAESARLASRSLHVLRVVRRGGFPGALRGQGHWPTPTDVRTTLEELGVVFVKFGQVLALRRDLLPASYVSELERLQDRMPPEDPTYLRETITRELGAPLHALFATFDERPMAAASIAQVHAATMPDGRAVVVKVRRRGLEERVAEDMAILAYLAARAEQVAPRLRAIDLIGMVREFRDSLRREMNLALEGRTIRRFRESLRDDRDVWIPDVVPERTSDAVLTLEHSPGTRIDAYGAEHPAQAGRLARAVAALLLRQVFETGLFNADPHPGNLFVLPDGRLCLHDFGMIGELDTRLRDGLLNILEATVAGDARAMATAYLEIGAVGEGADRAAFEADLSTLLRRVRERPLAEVSVGDALDSLLRVGSQHRIRNPGELLLLARAFLIAEGVMRQLDPTINVIELFSAEVRRVERQRLSPERLLEQGRELGRDIERMIREAPADARRALRRVADGELGRVYAPTMETIARHSTRSIERLTGALVSSALLVAGALLVSAGGWHRSVGDTLLAAGVLGVAATAVGALTASHRRDL